ncbi:response regulator transcription factor [Cellvibrio sp. OA-2007]|uniref:response regulator transcription factor n=1 Tax=Cellvibrio sp. OA-2007 TaxID=529823 RepID=UPI0007855C88|nr:response regulator transcription factor [Cellvibrio sp. OA-2007]
MVNLLIADDHPFYMQGLTLSVSDADINVLEHISDVHSIIEAYKRLKPDVFLCDIKFGQEQTSGLDVLEKLLTIDPKAKVILLSQYDQDMMIKQSYAAGAKAFLSKSIAREDLINAIQTVAKGELYFTPENALILARLTYDKAPDERPLEEILNEKEIEVMRLLTNGSREKDAAAELDVTVRTIAKLKASIKEKLNVDSDSSLIKLALKHGLISMDD